MSPRARRQQTTTTTETNTGTMTQTPPAATMVAESTAAPAESRAERIAQRAYALYERRGGQGGSPEDDWFQAEREVDSEA